MGVGVGVGVGVGAEESGGSLENYSEATLQNNLVSSEGEKPSDEAQLWSPPACVMSWHRVGHNHITTHIQHTRPHLAIYNK